MALRALTHQADFKKVALTKEEKSKVLLPVMLHTHHRESADDGHAHACVKKNKPIAYHLYRIYSMK